MTGICRKNRLRICSLVARALSSYMGHTSISDFSATKKPPSFRAEPECEDLQSECMTATQCPCLFLLHSFLPLDCSLT